MTLIQTNEINYENKKTIFLTEKSLHEFLMSEAIPCLSSRFKDPQNFYDTIINKLPNAQDKTNFKFIYSHLIQFYPHDYLDKSELAQKHSLDEEDILAEGSVKLMDTSLDESPMVRWLIVSDNKQSRNKTL